MVRSGKAEIVLKGFLHRGEFLRIAVIWLGLFREKRVIVEVKSIWLMHRVTILPAVEAVTSKRMSTLDMSVLHKAMLCKSADRERIVEGLLVFDDTVWGIAIVALLSRPTNKN